jgi:hypothetical protein
MKKATRLEHAIFLLQRKARVDTNTDRWLDFDKLIEDE